MHAQIEPFFDTDTCTVTYVVHAGPGTPCAVIDSVLDYDPKSGRTRTLSADRVAAFIEAHGARIIIDFVSNFVNERSVTQGEGDVQRVIEFPAWSIDDEDMTNGTVSIAHVVGDDEDVLDMREAMSVFLYTMMCGTGTLTLDIATQDIKNLIHHAAILKPSLVRCSRRSASRGATRLSASAFYFLKTNRVTPEL